VPTPQSQGTQLLQLLLLLNCRTVQQLQLLLLLNCRTVQQ
jgi:hypothetical protein